MVRSAAPPILSTMSIPPQGHESPPSPGLLCAWAVALRPRSLGLSAGPVLVGSASALGRDGAIDLGLAMLALAAAGLTQLVTNLQNDVGYTVRGGEAVAGRIGLPRATARGWLSVSAVQSAVVALSVVAVMLGLALAWHRGWPVLALGTASLLAALAYMGGPRPIAYTPYGEATVFLFFGVVALAGTIYVQAGDVGPPGWVAGIAFGLLAGAVLAVNNHRDIAHDATTGRRTMAVVLGARGSRLVYRASVLAAFALVPAIAWLAGSAWLLLPLVLLPRALLLLGAFDAAAGGHAFTPVLFRTVLLEASFGVLLAAGAVLARLLP